MGRPGQYHSKSDDQSLFVGIDAVKACQRPNQPPLLWVNSDYVHISDTKESMKEWMKGTNKRISSKDIITDVNCVAGHEADFVIFLGSTNVSAYMSRCRGQFVHIE